MDNLSFGDPTNTIVGSPMYDELSGELYAPVQIAGQGAGYLFVVGNGTSESGPATPVWIWAAVGVGIVVIVAAAGAVVFLRRRRKSQISPTQPGTR